MKQALHIFAARLNNLSHVGWLLLRIITGLFLIPHGLQKLFGWFGGAGLEGTASIFSQQFGIPLGTASALIAGLIQVIGGSFLALGLLTRLSALAIFAVLIVATYAHWPLGYFGARGGFPYPLQWAICALFFALNGGGRYSLDHKLKLEP